MPAPVASGWSVRRVGLAPTGKAPPCHGARGKRTFLVDGRLDGPFCPSRHEGSIAACTRIRGTVFPVEASYAIGTGFQFQIDVRIRHLIACRPVADHEEDGIFLREIQEMMAIACS